MNIKYRLLYYFKFQCNSKIIMKYSVVFLLESYKNKMWARKILLLIKKNLFLHKANTELFLATPCSESARSDP